MSGLIKTPQENLPLSNNWLMDCQYGLIKGWSAAKKFGMFSAVTTSFTDIWPVATNITYLTAAATLEAISSNANDTAAGSGARTIVVEGLDENWDEVSETITMAGTSASTATTATFIRVNRAYVATVGAYGGTNAGNITIRVSSAGSTQAYILADYSQTLQIYYSVPRLKIIDIHEVHLVADVQKYIDCRFQVRENADDSTVPCSPWLTKASYVGINGLNDISYLVPMKVNGKSDLRVQGKVASSTAGISAEIVYSIRDEDLT